MAISLRIAGLLLPALGLLGCNNNDGQDPNDHLTGNHQFIFLTFDTASNEFLSATAALSFDGDRRYSSDLTGPQITNREGAVASGGWTAAGTYQVGGDNQSLTLDTVYSGGLGGEERFITAGTNADGSNPSLAVAIRRQSGMFFLTDIQGSFHLLSFGLLVADGDRQSAAGLVTFDGSGSWSGAADFNDEGTLALAQAIDGAYSLNNYGNLEFSGMIGAEQSEGAFRDLSTGITASSNGGNDPRVYILIKEGSGMSVADLDGAFFLGGFIAGGTNIARKGTISFDGAGGFTSSFSANTEGTVTSGNESGTYSVAANGRVTLVVAGGGPTYTGAVRHDGAFGAVAGVTDTEAPALLTFTRK